MEKGNNAFTLAEVLITLAIVGIIAALTIPTLMNKYQRHTLNAQFRKAESQIYNVVRQWQTDEGEDLYSLYYGKNKQTVENAFYKYLKGEIDTRDTYGLPNYKTSMKNSTTNAHVCSASCCAHPVYRSFQSIDGIMYNICTRDNKINIGIDINGYDKGPNKLGIDLFDFHINPENKFYYEFRCTPGYCYAYANRRTNTHVNDGLGCTHCAVSDSNYFNKIDL